MKLSRREIAVFLVAGMVMAWGSALVPGPYRWIYAFGVSVATAVFLVSMALEDES